MQKNRKTLRSLFKTTFPSLILVWIWYLIEIFGNYTGEADKAAVLAAEIRVFAGYTLTGLFIGGLSGGILAVKKKKYSDFFENDLKNYLKYFYRSTAFSGLILFILLSREIINRPLLFSSTFLNSGFILSPVFGFLKDNFSPLYFTVIFVIIILMCLHNTARNLSIYNSLIPLSGYVLAAAGSVILIFNTGYLNASEDTAVKKNVIMIGIEGFSREMMTKRMLNDRPFLGILRSFSYDFINYFSVSNDPRTAFLSVLTSKYPDNAGYAGGIESYGLEKNSLFMYFSEKGYSCAYFADPYYAYDRFLTDGPSPKIPSRKETVISKVYAGHTLLPVLYNNRFLSGNFREAKIVGKGGGARNISENIRDICSSGRPFIVSFIIRKEDPRSAYPYHKMNGTDTTEIYTMYIDEELGSVIDILKKNGRYENTVFCLTGIPEKGRGLKASSFRIPLYIGSPSDGKYRSVKNNYSTVDVFPTVAQYAGIPAGEDDYDGVSFLSPEFIRQNIVISDHSLFTENSTLISGGEYDHTYKRTDNSRQIIPLIPRSLIRGDYKLDVYPAKSGIAYSLYDIKSDPDEKSDLIGQESGIASKMKQMYSGILNKEFGMKMINGYAFR